MIRGMKKTIWVLDDAKATLLIDEGAGVSEVARRLGVSRQTVYAAIKKGRIPAPNARLGSTNSLDRDGTAPDAGRVETQPTPG